MSQPSNSHPQGAPGLVSANTLVADLLAGSAVFLVAVPLCLGIALASDAPLFAGVVAGIIGGLVVGSLSGSNTSVSGPAAGLTAVVATQIATLGSFDAFLAAVVLAGLLQISMGLLRAGSIANFVPSSVITGLLAAIGILLILKQIPHLVGHDNDPLGEMSFFQPDNENTLSELVLTLADFHRGAAVVGLISLAMLVVWPKIPRLAGSRVPPSLLVVLVGVAINELFGASGAGPDWLVGSTHLVQVPAAQDLTEFMGFFRLPSFSAPPLALATAAVTLALVASLETILNLEAIDKIDPQKRVSPPNRELVAQGVGNLVSGLVGGLPVTSVIVRGSVNVNAGAKTKLATIVHGALLVLFVALLPGLLNRIPLAALAAILIHTGLKLTSPKVIKAMWSRGAVVFVPFATTVVMIVFTDLLVGTLAGLVVAMTSILRNNYKRSVRRVMEKHITGSVLRIELAEQVSFLNRAALLEAFNAVQPGQHVLIDARNSRDIDPDVMAMLLEYQEETGPARGAIVSSLGLADHHERLQDRIQFVDCSARDLQEKVTPDQVLDILKAGNERFYSGRPLVRDVGRQIRATAEQQHPLAIVLSGTSSRTPVEAIFDVGMGEISCTRSTANCVGEAVLASIEYATEVDGVKLIVVMGHTNNDAMRLAVESLRGERVMKLMSLNTVLEYLYPAIDLDRARDWHQLSPAEQRAFTDDISREHVRRSMLKILRHSPAIRQRVEAGTLKLVGCMYDAETGRVEMLSGGDARELLRQAAQPSVGPASLRRAGRPGPRMLKPI